MNHRGLRGERQQRAKRKGQRVNTVRGITKLLALSSLLFACVLSPLWLISSSSSKGREMAVQERTKIRAPELTGDRGWLNTSKPLSLAALKGKVVLLDFWTYGCINCRSEE